MARSRDPQTSARPDTAISRRAAVPVDHTAHAEAPVELMQQPLVRAQLCGRIHARMTRLLYLTESWASRIRVDHALARGEPYERIRARTARCCYLLNFVGVPAPIGRRLPFGSITASRVVSRTNAFALVWLGVAI